jgi:prepilin-type N-terminal cleavage/methylation domain-containing protein
MRRTIRNSRERGYNLIELLVAMALLATVLMSILTLFVWGRRNVYSGKQLTRATSVTTHVLEDLQPLSVSSFNTEFKITSSTVMTGDPTVAGVKYTDVILRTTDDLSQENTVAPAPQYLSRWEDLIAADDGTKFYEPRVTLVIKPDELKTAGDPTSAAIVRIRIVTEWTEGQRKRNVMAEVTKFNREN